MEKKDFLLDIYKDKRTVFRLSDIAMLFPMEESKYLGNRMGYYVKTGRFLNPRKGIYAKPGFNPMELANILFTPSYISLEYVLQQAGIIFQYDSRYTNVSYLTRQVEIEGKVFSYRRIREDIMMDSTGIVRREDQVNIATPERAFLDMLYLYKDFYFDNLHPLDRKLIDRILPAYGSATLKKRAAKILGNG